MAEVLGVVSAAAQLATLCCSLLRVMKKLKGAGLTLQSYQLQLRDLSLLSNSISRNPLLQTSEIESLTQSLLSLISQTNLTVVLRKHRIIRTLYILCREKDLLETLTAVERQKLSLCLTIEQIQSDVLFEIRANIQDMSYEQPNVGKRRISAPIQARETSTSQPNGNNSNMRPAPARTTATDDETANNDSPTAQVDGSDEDSYVSDFSDHESVVDGDSCNESCDGRLEQSSTSQIKGIDLKKDFAPGGSTTTRQKTVRGERAADGPEIAQEAQDGITDEPCVGKLEQTSITLASSTALKNNPAPSASTIAAGETGQDGRAADGPRITHEEHVATEPLDPEKNEHAISNVYCSDADQRVGNRVIIEGREAHLVEGISIIKNVRHCGKGNQTVGSRVNCEGRPRNKFNAAAVLGPISNVYHFGDGSSKQDVGGKFKYQKR